MVLVLATAALAVLIAVALVVTIRGSRRRQTTPSAKLPVGAEAAIWSILEAVPDPRNHLALTRDLTGEVRITGTPLDPAVRSRTTAPTAPAAEDLWADEPEVAFRFDDAPLDLRSLERAS